MFIFSGKFSWNRKVLIAVNFLNDVLCLQFWKSQGQLKWKHEQFNGFFFQLESLCLTGVYKHFLDNE